MRPALILLAVALAVAVAYASRAPQRAEAANTCLCGVDE